MRVLGNVVAIALVVASVRLFTACVGDDPIPATTTTGDGGATAADGEESGKCFGNGTCLRSDLECRSDRCVRRNSSVGDSGGGGGDAGGDGNGDGDLGCDAGPPPSASDGPGCVNTTCARGEVCCKATGSADVRCTYDGTSTCEGSTPRHRCEDKSQCPSAQVCCLSFQRGGTNAAACTYSMTESYCASSCPAFELQLCSSNVPTCPQGTTCQGIRVTGLTVDRVAGACR